MEKKTGKATKPFSFDKAIKWDRISKMDRKELEVLNSVLKGETKNDKRR